MKGIRLNPQFATRLIWSPTPGIRVAGSAANRILRIYMSAAE